MNIEALRVNMLLSKKLLHTLPTSTYFLRRSNWFSIVSSIWSTLNCMIKNVSFTFLKDILHNLCLLLYLPSDIILRILHLSLVRFIMTPEWILKCVSIFQRGKFSLFLAPSYSPAHFSLWSRQKWKKKIWKFMVRLLSFHLKYRM